MGNKIFWGASALALIGYVTYRYNAVSKQVAESKQTSDQVHKEQATALVNSLFARDYVVGDISSADAEAAMIVTLDPKEKSTSPTAFAFDRTAYNRMLTAAGASLASPLSTTAAPSDRVKLAFINTKMNPALVAKYQADGWMLLDSK